MKGSIILTGYEFKILQSLESPRESQDIASGANINKTGIYKMLHRMESKGLIVRYGELYQLTLNGREILQSYKNISKM